MLMPETFGKLSIFQNCPFRVRNLDDQKPAVTHLGCNHVVGCVGTGVIIENSSVGIPQLRYPDQDTGY